MRTTALFVCCILLCGCSHGTSGAHSDKESAYGEHWKTGQELIKLIQSSADEKVLNRFIGRRAAFAGGNASYGGDADLVIAEGVGLRVIIAPLRDVRPQAVTWGAEVDGIILEVDGQARIITLKVKPEHYEVGDTM